MKQHDKLNGIQKEILHALLKEYEKSKTYRGENRVTQSFTVTPKQFFHAYDSDFVDLDAQDAFEQDVKELGKQGLVIIDTAKDGVIKKIRLNVESTEEIYFLLGRTPLAQQEQEQIAFYSLHASADGVLGAFCRDQIERLQNRKKARYGPQDAAVLVDILLYMDGNETEIYERELSIELFHDSKRFENEYRNKLLTVLKNYGTHDAFINEITDQREREHTLLSEYGIVSNPSYVNFKGNGKVIMKNGDQIPLRANATLAISEDMFRQIQSIDVDDAGIMTVENLTSFNRIEKNGCFLLFLSGYHNTIRQKFLVKLFHDNPGKKWYHFGDLDPDGFYILEHLKEKTKIPFLPYRMSVNELKTYHQYGKALEPNDNTKAESLLKAGLYTEEMKYMLEHKMKLEQEVISWKEHMTIISERDAE